MQLIKGISARHCTRAAQRKRSSAQEFYYQIGKLFDDTADSAQESNLEVLVGLLVVVFTNWPNCDFDR